MADKDEIRLIDRRTLLQTNATIIAGMLIFLTIGQVFTYTTTRDTTFVFTIMGFGGLFTSMILCFATGEKGIRFTKNKLHKIFTGAEISFLFGVLFLFVTVIIILYAKLY